jgi:hypothetical protein
MRKHISFAIAAAMLGLAVGFWTATGVVETAASFGRSNAVVPTYRVIQVMPAAYLPGKEIEPARFPSPFPIGLGFEPHE